LPSKSDQQLRVSRALGLDLARSIELLPAVLRARVHVSLPVANANLADPAAAGDARASVLLSLRADRSTQLAEQVRTLVAGAVPGLDARAVTVVETIQPVPDMPCAELTRIGTINVTRGTVDTLKLWLALALSLLMLLSAAVLFLLRRERRSPPP
jgi:type III secretory pathway lipoprotein EscJ